ncbi:MAG: acetate kinase, partial [Clostridia bacterium]|nr:acetate kinase [Clostridia bacterium]
MNILVINAGSSSLKYQLIDMTDETVLAKGICEKITQKGSGLTHVRGENKYVLQYDMPDHKAALEIVLQTLCSEEYGVIKDLKEIQAIGHRVLHGAEDYKESVIVTDKVLEVCHKNRELGPLHMPANILCMEICKELLNAPQVAVFDTSFHQTMPECAYRYAVPEEDYVELRLRR